MLVFGKTLLAGRPVSRSVKAWTGPDRSTRRTIVVRGECY
jgi:hypothetical protein